MRGKGVKARYERVAVGITPAHAGKSQFPGPSPALPRDHPRACGEKTFKTYELDVSRGSPPRMRGKVMFAILGSVIPRITPAYAGKRHSVFGYGRNTRDHPRVCGEKCADHPCGCGRRGSPPHMRGKDTALPPGAFCHGITPAYAGKSFLPSLSRLCCWDHPRICGEKLPCRALPVRFRGSPPHMRGKVRRCSKSGYSQGITPAYAGKRNIVRKATLDPRDHPRICGEKHSCERLGSSL